MRAILINPQNKTVIEVECDGSLQDIYRLTECDCIDAVRLGDEEENTIFVDDEGLINNKVNTHGVFMVTGDNPAFLAGIGLMLAHNAEGESVGTNIDLAEFAKRIKFGELFRVGGRVVFHAADGTNYAPGW